MSLRKKARRWAGSFTLFLGLTACDDTQQIRSWIEMTDGLRIAAETSAEQIPYRNEQKETLRAYFRELNQMGRALQADAGFRDRANRAFAQDDLAVTCAKTFLAHSKWQTILEHCTRNGFFLCSDEVRTYPESRAFIRASLNPELQKRFDESGACSARESF